MLSECAKCKVRICYPRIKTGEPFPSIDKAPRSCPMRRMPDIINQARDEYQEPDIKEFARLASVQEYECYELAPDGIRTKNTRLDELIQFLQKCNYQKLGIAFCAGLTTETAMLTEVLEDKGFSVASVCCKVGQIPKEDIGILEDEKIAGPGRVETMCNPITQALVLNAEEVDLAVMLGLCIGHDTLFIRYCRVPLTVLAVKDRVLGHNPLAALYLSRSPYYSRFRIKADKTGHAAKVTIGTSK
ncbi:DUF1847 domain-containing protein [Thermodesulfobacteriota bacterium]